MWYALIVLVSCSCQRGSVSLSVLEISSGFHPIVLMFTCSGGTGNITLFRRIEGSVFEVLIDGKAASRNVIFTFNQHHEGYYYYQVGDSLSNEFLLVGKDKDKIHMCTEFKEQLKPCMLIISVCNTNMKLILM